MSDDLTQHRLDKLARIRERGDVPYKYNFDRSQTIGEARAALEALETESEEGVIIEVPSDYSEYHRELPQFSSTGDELKYLSEKQQYTMADGKEVGTHQGAHYFTKGQRKGLQVGGTPEPLFVIDTDVIDNIIYTGQGKTHPGLYRR